jgi:TldD protein
MSALATTDDIFFNRAGLDRVRTERVVDDALAGADDGELFLEWRQSEALVWDDGRLRSASFDTDQGFGLRAVAGEATGYGHAPGLDDASIARAAATVRAVADGHGGTIALPPPPTNRILYDDANPISAVPFETKVALLAEIDAYLRAKDPAVRQVSASIAATWQAVRIIRADGRHAADLRPLIRMSISVVAARGRPDGVRSAWRRRPGRL